MLPDGCQTPALQPWPSLHVLHLPGLPETELQTPNPVVGSGRSVLPPNTPEPPGPPALRPAPHTNRSRSPDDARRLLSGPAAPFTHPALCSSPRPPDLDAVPSSLWPPPAPAPSQENRGCRLAQSLAARTRGHTQQDDLGAGGRKGPAARSRLGPRCLASVPPSSPLTAPQAPRFFASRFPVRARPMPGSPQPSPGPPRKPTRPRMMPGTASCKEHTAPNWTRGRESQDPAPVWKSPGPRTLWNKAASRLPPATPEPAVREVPRATNTQVATRQTTDRTEGKTT